MAKHVLSAGEGELDFALVGISAAEDQYRITTLIDAALGTKLQLIDYVPFNLKEGRIFRFSLFLHSDTSLGVEFYLVPNSSNFEEPNINVQSTGLFSGIDVDESVRLIKELPSTDYFLLLKGEDLSVIRTKVIHALRAVPEIVQANAIEPAELPSRRNLIF